MRNPTTLSAIIRQRICNVNFLFNDLNPFDKPIDVA